MEKFNWERAAAIALCAALGTMGVCLAFRYLLPLLLPFLIAWGLSLIVRPLSARLSQRFRLSQKAFAVLLLLLLLGGSVLLLSLSVSRLFRELQALLSRMLTENGSFSDAVLESMDYFEVLTSRLGLLGEGGEHEGLSAFRASFNEMVSEMIGSFFNALSAGLPALAGRVIGALPTVFLVLIVTVISGFYFCIDGDSIGHALSGLLPKSLRQRLPAWQCSVRRVSWKYLRAYLILLLLTFAELFIGFSILRIEYAFLLALVVAVVDMLPVLGVGTVLVPWAAVMLLQKNFYLGFGLLILYGAVLILRQISEPKLVGKSLGLHPLLTLFASYAGWKLLGLLGMIFGPMLALLAKSLSEQLRKS